MIRNIDLLLHGDSITQGWGEGEENRAVFDKYFGGSAIVLEMRQNSDNLHPQARGYEIWGKAAQAKLAELLK